jgi:hypothetical protein
MQLLVAERAELVELFKCETWYREQKLSPPHTACCLPTPIEPQLRPSLRRLEGARWPHTGCYHMDVTASLNSECVSTGVTS